MATATVCGHLEKFVIGLSLLVSVAAERGPLSVQRMDEVMSRLLEKKIIHVNLAIV